MIPRSPADGRIASAAIQKWKADPAIRAEFGTLTSFHAFARAQEYGLIGGPKVLPPEQPCKAPAAAHQAACAVATPQPVTMPRPAPAASVEPERPRSGKPATWPADLALELQQHKERLMASGMGYGDAFDEARSLVVMDNPQRFA
ncbi:MAG: hypothetical protein NDI91_17310 [Sulfuritalea sp.]|nr:hypothetical protein [Sulfuritalea sp.]